MAVVLLLADRVSSIKVRDARGMVIFRDPHGHRMITTPVKRVLGEPAGKMIYVETENSVYKLEIHGEPLFPMKPSGE